MSSDRTYGVAQLLIAPIGLLIFLVVTTRTSVDAQDVTDLPIGTPFVDNVSGLGSERFYQLSPAAGEHLMVLLAKPTGFASRLDINFKAPPTDSDTDDSDGGDMDGSDQAVDISVTKAGSYFVRVRATCCDAGGPYGITAHTAATLPALPIGTPVTGRLAWQQAERYYRVSPTAREHIRVVLEKPTHFASRLDIKFKVLPTDTDSDGSDGGAFDGSDQAVDINLTKSGDYFVRVTAECCDQGGTYTITTRSLVAPACPGDCDGGGDVTVDELLTMVNIALGEADPSACSAGDVNSDGQLTIEELLTAVRNALIGCP